MKTATLLVFATPEQVTNVQTRIRSVPAYGPLCEHVPMFKTVVDALPDLDKLWRLPRELQIPILDGLKWAGVNVPAEAWESVGVKP